MKARGDVIALIGLVAVVGTVAGSVTGCGPTRHSPPVVITTTTIAAPTPTITVLRSVRVVTAGTTATFQAQAGVSLTLRAGRPSLSRQRLSSSYGYAPAHGYYVTFAVTIVNRGTSPVAIAPSDFSVQVIGEGRVTTTSGNAPYSGASAELDATQIDPGDTVSGPLTFDVRRPHGSLSYAPDGKPAITWRY